MKNIIRIRRPDQIIYNFQQSGQANISLDIKYDFYKHYHPYVGELLKILNISTLDELMTPKNQEQAGLFLSRIYQKSEGAKVEFVGENDQLDLPGHYIDTSVEGAYSIYNWELFFHIPVTIAVHLSKNQRHAEAQKWFHYVFDPTNSSNEEEAHLKFWNFKAFRATSAVQMVEDDLKALQSNDVADEKRIKNIETTISDWRKNPFQPHRIARNRIVSYQLQVVMKYLDNLIAWGDSLFKQDTIETINEATQMYILSANILGDRPQEIPKRGKTSSKSFKQLREGLDAFSNAMIEMETEFPYLLNRPKSDDVKKDETESLFGIGKALYFCIPKNDKLLSYWDTVSDRLFKIRHCMNMEGIVRQLPLFQPPIDPGMLVRAAAGGIDISGLISGLNQPISPIRSTLLLQKAMELASDLKSLGGSLLSAIEKRDSETLGQLRQEQEIRMMELNTEVRFMQWKDSEANTDSLLKSRESSFLRYKHYQMLLGKKEEDYADLESLEIERKAILEGSTQDEREGSFNGLYDELIEKYSSDIEESVFDLKVIGQDKNLHLSSSEVRELGLQKEVGEIQDAAAGFRLTSPAMAMIPDFPIKISFWGIGGDIVFGGTKLQQFLNNSASILDLSANIKSRESNEVSKIGSYERRAHDWTLQSNLAAKELTQNGRQIISSLLREQITKKEYENQKQQLSHSIEISTFLKDKFSNAELYNWMQSEVSKVFHDCYKFAYDLAKKAETTMKWELMRPEMDAQQYIKFNYWDTGRKGLLSGEMLYLDLKKMEMAYFEQNKREYELTKHISIRQLNPVALLQLKTQGWCEIHIPEWLFDLDTPGHYMRRIKTISISIPAIAGPYTSINCMLSLQKSVIRKSSIGDSYMRDTEEEDSRFMDYYGTIQSIVTSNAQNDSGLFEVNLGDQRYLPFEGSGAISTWRLELPEEHKQFDYNSINDVIIHMRYTARQGGAQLKAKAAFSITELLSQIDQNGDGGLFGLFSLRHDFPQDWHKYQISIDSETTPQPDDFTSILERKHFAYLANGKTIRIDNTQSKLWLRKKDEIDSGTLTFNGEELDTGIDASLEIKVIHDDLDGVDDAFVIIRYLIED